MKPVAVSVAHGGRRRVAMATPAVMRILPIGAPTAAAATASAAANAFTMVMPRSLSPTLPPSEIKKSRCSANVAGQGANSATRSDEEIASMLVFLRLCSS
jgi:hypothetical protein